MSKVTIEDIDEVRDRVIDATTIDDYKHAAKICLFIVERLWNEVRKAKRK